MQRCNMQHATKPITTAIKLATLQQNGWDNVRDACNDVVFINIFKNSYSMLTAHNSHVRAIETSYG